MDREIDSVFYIEAKRLNAKDKLNSIVADFERALDSHNRDLLIPKAIQPQNQYILLLVDIWSEEDYKKEWIAKWEAQNPLLFVNEQSILKCIDTNKIAAGSIHKISKEIIENYYIAYSLYKIM